MGTIACGHFSRRKGSFGRLVLCGGFDFPAVDIGSASPVAAPTEHGKTELWNLRCLVSLAT
jgi:hypothetical protein